MIYGNKEGIRDSLLAKLETLYDIEIPAEVFAPAELLDVLAAFTCAINREISIYVSRSGEVLDITIGGVSSVELKDMHLRRNTKRLSMVRCIHTHPVRYVPCGLTRWRLLGRKTATQPAYRRHFWANMSAV